MHTNISELHSPASPTDARHKELAARLSLLARVDGLNQTPFAPLTLSRATTPTQRMPTVYQPALCVVVQGSKRATLGEEVFNYDPLNYLVVSVALPMMSQIVQASPEHPYLCLRLALDVEQISTLLLERDKAQAPVASRATRGLYVSRLGDSLLDAVLRLVRLLDTPQELSVLGPLAVREIHYRLLIGELGHRLVDLVAGGNTQRVSRAINWISERYTEPLRIEQVAEAVHMSPSTLHHRFKALTSMSPLQYQKQLRLHEARRLMLTEDLDCAVAAHRVGYESPSQFSREYRRLFGAPPRLEITRLRKSA